MPQREMEGEEDKTFIYFFFLATGLQLGKK